MLKQSLMTATAVALVTAISAGTAVAQKSKNTVRMGYYDPISMVDTIYDPKPETGFTTNAVFDQLLFFDTRDSKFKSRIAEKWTRINPTTWEFKIKKGLKFHDGSALDADDVVYTANWASDPKVKFRIKSRFLWIKRAEKIDQHTVRLVAKRPFITMLPRMARSMSIYPSDVHGALKVKSTFGRNPVGSGPYRAVSVDPNTGVVLERVTNYALASEYNPAGSIQRFELKPLPEVQTQVAQMLVGGLDVMYRVPKDQLDNLTANPNFTATIKKTGVLINYIALDAAGRSGIEALKNVKVRQAIMTAINRAGIQRTLVAGGAAVPPIEALCFRHQSGCDYSAKLPAYDPAKAKKLLAESGFQNINVTITSVVSVNSQITQAISGYLRAIGIQAKVSQVPFGPYRKRQREGKINILVNPWASGGLPDVGSTLDFFWSKGARNLSRDPVIDDLLAKSNSEFNPTLRKQINRQLLDRVTEMAYIHPVTVTPPVFVHNKDLVINEEGGDHTFGALANQMRWK